MAEEAWSRHVGHLEEGGLYGWCARCPPEERHRAIERTVRADGYATAIRRLNFLANVANRKDNEPLHRVAGEDEEWARRWEGESRDDEDRRRKLGTHHRVRGFEREVEGRRERVRSHLARNPRRRQPARSHSNPVRADVTCAARPTWRDVGSRNSGTFPTPPLSSGGDPQ